jgi:hypothetical protein
MEAPAEQVLTDTRRVGDERADVPVAFRSERFASDRYGQDDRAPAEQSQEEPLSEGPIEVMNLGPPLQ